MKQAAFGKAVQALFAQHEKLITRRNSKNRWERRS
jgi:hypothetical protein